MRAALHGHGCDHPCAVRVASSALWPSGSCADHALAAWGRNDRAEFAANVGGYAGAPDDGEFALLMENHSGEGGPRYELQELLVWLEGVRKIQRFLGFAESELTYLYDIAVWGT